MSVERPRSAGPDTCADRPGCHKHQPLIEDTARLEAGCGKWLRDEGSIKFEIHDAGHESPGRSGGEFHHHIGTNAVIARQDGSKASAGRALERAQPEYTLRLAGAHFADRLIRQAQQAISIGEQGVPLRRETDGAPLAAEQPGTEMFFQLADARRHIGLNAIELVGGTDDPALVDTTVRKIFRDLRSIVLITRTIQQNYSFVQAALRPLFRCMRSEPGHRGLTMRLNPIPSGAGEPRRLPHRETVSPDAIASSLPLPELPHHAAAGSLISPRRGRRPIP